MHVSLVPAFGSDAGFPTSHGGRHGRPPFLPTPSTRPSRTRAAREGARTHITSPLAPGHQGGDEHVKSRDASTGFGAPLQQRVHRHAEAYRTEPRAPRQSPCPRHECLGPHVPPWVGVCGRPRALPRPVAVYFGSVAVFSQESSLFPSPRCPWSPSLQKLLRATQPKATSFAAAFPHPDSPLPPPTPPPPTRSACARSPAGSVARARGTVRVTRARARACGGRVSLTMDRFPTPPSHPHQRFPPRVAQAHSGNLAFL